MDENHRYSIPGHLFCGFLLVLLIVASPNLNFPLAILMGVTIFLAFKPEHFIIKVLKPCIIGSVFTLLLVLPSLFLGNQGILFLPIKVFATILVFSYLTNIMLVHKLVSSLGYFYILSIVILILGLTLNYIVILGNTAIALLEAMKLRAVGKHRGKYNSLAGVVGVTFLKSQVYAEETYQAMVCRCFAGNYNVNYKRKVSMKTLYYACFCLLVIMFFGLCYHIR